MHRQGGKFLAMYARFRHKSFLWSGCGCDNIFLGDDVVSGDGGKNSHSSSGAALFSPAFEVLSPDVITTPLVFNSPHSGNIYPAEFIASSKLDAHRLRLSEDCFVDQIFDQVPALGAPLLKAHFPRAYIDVNREPYELDPAMFSEALPPFVNTRSLRVAGGLGTIARIVSDNEEIYRNLLTFNQAKERISSLYYPYHARLGGLIKASHARFGASLLIDCHSMPSNRPGFSSTGLTRTSRDKNRPDFVLGDRFGQTCPHHVIEFLEQKLVAMGYTVVRNKPYAGGFITQKYGGPRHNQHSIQIEINRSLYLDEDRLELHDGFEELKSNLMQIMDRLATMTIDLLMAPRWAAE
jgi:N-formylglutamate amidohydrolase